MKEKHYAYKVTLDSCGLIYSHFEFTEDKMLDLLKEVQREHSEGIFWIFKQIDDKPKEQLCVIDCAKKRIYYHYSGEVDQLQDAIEHLSR